jgi:serine/threonine protein kinase/formylglycine-generating enzyme required for sulfatase activity
MSKPLTRVGNYELLDRIDRIDREVEGGQARVYKARCISEAVPGVASSELVALKILHHMRDEIEVIRFNHESEILRKLGHPSIVRYKDSFVWSDALGEERGCVVMELLEGHTLKSLVKKHPEGLPWEQARKILGQVLSAVRYAINQHRVIHRDLKPSNIFITRNDETKLIDFGIARHQSGDETGTSTSAGLIGTLDYMAPDFARLQPEGQKVFRGDEQSDIFSFGVCLYQLLTGKLPFLPPLEDSMQYHTRWTVKRPPEVDCKNHSTSFPVLKGLHKCVTRCLAVDRDARYKSFDEVASDFECIARKTIKRGAYEYVERLGKGAYGEVFRGQRTRDGCEVAIKHLFSHHHPRRFLKEANILRHTAHPHLVQYLDLVVENDELYKQQHYLVLEYLKGIPDANLDYRIQASGARVDPVKAASLIIKPYEAIRLFIGYLDCLDHLHRQKIIHRDIKPNNLYAPAGDPDGGKLFDLGVAYDVKGTLTHGGVTGTWNYIAPEFRFDKTKHGLPQSDIYSIGVSFYETLTTKLPFPRLPASTTANPKKTEAEYIRRADSPVKCPLAQADTDGTCTVGCCDQQTTCPFEHPVFKEHPDLIPVIRRALVRNPYKRHATAGEMRDELQRALDSWLRKSVAPTISPTSPVDTGTTHPPPEELPAAGPPSGEQTETATDVTAKPVSFPSAGVATEETKPADMEVLGRELDEAKKTQRKGRKLFPRLALTAAIMVLMGIVGWGVYYKGPTVLEGYKLEKAREFVVKHTQPEPKSFSLDEWNRLCELANLKVQAKGVNAQEWQGILKSLTTSGRLYPAALRKAFETEVSQKNIGAAETLLKKWEEIPQPDRIRLGIPPNEYLKVVQDMRTARDRLLVVKVMVKSDPPGAEVISQGISLGLTPKSEDWPPGTYELVARYSNLEEQRRTLEVKPGGQGEEVVFVFPHGSLELKSDPLGAKVLFAGNLLGYTPFTNNVLRPGEIVYQLDLNGYQVTNVAAQISEKSRQSLLVKLTRMTEGVQFTSDPDGAVVFLDGKELGKTPTSSMQLPTGPNKLTARYLGVEVIKSVVVRRGEPSRCDFKFPSGSLRIESDLVGAEVVAAGKVVGRTPFTTNLLVALCPVTYEIRKGDRSTNLTVTVLDGQPVTKNVVLSSGKGTLLLTSEPRGAKVFWRNKGSEELLGMTQLKTVRSKPIDKGPQILIARHPVLGEQEIRVLVKADEEVPVNVAFAYGSVEVRTEPANVAAEVFDGNNKLGSTPYWFEMVKVGPVKYRIQSEDYEDAEVEGIIVARQANELVAKLELGRGTLVLNSDPAGAQVFLDGQLIGRKLPLTLTNTVRAGSHKLKAKYLDSELPERTVRVRKGQAAPPELFRFPHGSVELTSNPLGADVWLNGKKDGVTPYTNLFVVPGAHTFTVRKGKQSKLLDLPVSDGQHIVPPMVQLGSGTGRLRITSDPPGVEIFWAEQLLGKTTATPLETKPIDEKLQKLVARHPVLGETNQSVQVEADVVTDVRVIFDYSKVWLQIDPTNVVATALRSDGKKLDPGLLQLFDEMAKPGIVKYEVKADGYFATNVAGTVLAGEENRLFAKLVKIPPKELPVKPPPPPPTTTTNSIGMELAWVKDVPGTEGGCWVGIYEVTQTEYYRVMGKNPSMFKKGGRFPVENVNFGEAAAFCAKLTQMDAATTGIRYQLPTEEQWKHLAVKGETQLEDSVTSKERAAKNESNRLNPEEVGSTRRPNKFGLFDIRGNVWEMCATADGTRKCLGGSYKQAFERSQINPGLPGPLALDYPGAQVDQSEEVGFRVIGIGSNPR